LFDHELPLFLKKYMVGLARRNKLHEELMGATCIDTLSYRHYIIAILHT
jgi:hypothetical protein